MVLSLINTLFSLSLLVPRIDATPPLPAALVKKTQKVSEDWDATPPPPRINRETKTDPSIKMNELEEQLRVQQLLIAQLSQDKASMAVKENHAQETGALLSPTFDDMFPQI